MSAGEREIARLGTESLTRKESLIIEDFGADPEGLNLLLQAVFINPDSPQSWESARTAIIYSNYETDEKVAEQLIRTGVEVLNEENSESVLSVLSLLCTQVLDNSLQIAKDSGLLEKISFTREESQLNVISKMDIFESVICCDEDLSEFKEWICCVHNNIVLICCSMNSELVQREALKISAKVLEKFELDQDTVLSLIRVYIELLSNEHLLQDACLKCLVVLTERYSDWLDPILVENYLLITKYLTDESIMASIYAARILAVILAKIAMFGSDFIRPILSEIRNVILGQSPNVDHVVNLLRIIAENSDSGCGQILEMGILEWSRLSHFSSRTTSNMLSIYLMVLKYGFQLIWTEQVTANVCDGLESSDDEIALMSLNILSTNSDLSKFTDLADVLDDMRRHHNEEIAAAADSLFQSLF